MQSIHTSGGVGKDIYTWYCYQTQRQHRQLSCTRGLVRGAYVSLDEYGSLQMQQCNTDLRKKNSWLRQHTEKHCAIARGFLPKAQTLESYQVLLINTASRNNCTRKNIGAAMPANNSSNPRGQAGVRSRPAFLIAAPVPSGGRPDFSTSRGRKTTSVRARASCCAVGSFSRVKI